METSSHFAARQVAALLGLHGVRRAVLSPGSRNAPLIIALARHHDIDSITVVDERQAAFVALGISLISDEPVALVCTSGTAMLNYAPAVAEAFYRKVPLIVVTADRPSEWIDQDDSQTLVQPGALTTFVKQTYDIPADIDATTDGRWLTNRLINDAILTATSGRRGPVHINVRINAPLGTTGDYNENIRSIGIVNPRQDLTVAESRDLGRRLVSPRKVLIIAGFSSPSGRLSRALGRLAELPNVAIMTETPANVHARGVIGRIDTVMSALTDDERRALTPDIVITTGGALVSRMVKEWLRSATDIEHWHVGITHTTTDCFRHLTLRVEMEAPIFFQQLASAMQPHRAPSDYAARWQTVSRRAVDSHDRYVNSVPWSDLRAFATILPAIPRRWNLQLSNGTSVRYAQLFDCSHIHRCDCNRGVSGIDGSTSTALGATIAYRHDPTLLISGDMSATYDIGALFSGHLSPRFKMVVVNNSGGGIFRFISSTSELDEREERFSWSPAVPWREIAAGLGLAFFEADSEEALKRAWPRFAAESERPALLIVTTPAEQSAAILKDYFKRH